MSSRILTSEIIGLDALCADPAAALRKAHQGTLAVFHNNAPAFYAISAERLATLLALEEQMATPAVDIALDEALYNDAPAATSPVPMGKFAMYPGWAPDADFQRMAALWGIHLSEAVTAEELASFVAYWQAEGKVFHHVQWQQKLARSLQIGRAATGGQPRRDMNTLSQPGNDIPDGFRG